METVPGFQQRASLEAASFPETPTSGLLTLEEKRNVCTGLFQNSFSQQRRVVIPALPTPEPRQRVRESGGEKGRGRKRGEREKGERERRSGCLDAEGKQGSCKKEATLPSLNRHG